MPTRALEFAETIGKFAVTIGKFADGKGGGKMSYCYNILRSFLLNYFLFRVVFSSPWVLGAIVVINRILLVFRNLCAEINLYAFKRYSFY